MNEKWLNLTQRLNALSSNLKSKEGMPNRRFRQMGHRGINSWPGWSEYMMKCIAALCSCIALLIVAGGANPAPIHIGHGLIGNQNPHETGAIVLGSYFDPDQGTYNNYWSYESRIFDYWRFMHPRFWYPDKIKNMNNKCWYKC